MSPSIQTEARLILVSAAAGAGLMAVYDGLRIFRLLVRHSWLWVGGLRFCVIGGVLAAMLVYDRVFSANFMKLLKKTGRWIRIKRKR